MIENNDVEAPVTGRAKGGKKRAQLLSPEERQAIARKGAVARWGVQATHKGSFKEEFGIDVDCYVLNDAAKSAFISQRGMAAALGFSSQGGGRFPRFLSGKTIAPYLGLDLKEKLEKPVTFLGPKAVSGAPSSAKLYGFDVTLLIDVCKAITQAEADGKILPSQKQIAKQAHVIVNASAKAGIKGLVYALAGYSPSTEEVIAAFKLYVQEEAKKYESEFPNELYMQWHRLYNIPVAGRGKPWQFKHLTVNHIYYPLAKSSGKLYGLLKALKATDGDKQKKLFQFLNDIGARALRMQLGRVLEMCESSSDKTTYEAKIVERFGGQQELELIFPSSPNGPQPPSSQSPNAS
jgi:P63C domain